MKNGEEEDGDPSQSGNNNQTASGSEDMNVTPQQQQQPPLPQQQQQQQPPQPQQQMMMGMQGQTNFPGGPGPMQGNMQGNMQNNMQGPMGMMGPRGPLGMMPGGPQMRPGGPMGGQNINLNMNMNMNAGNMGGMPNRPPMGPAGMRPGMDMNAGMRPGMDMNIQQQSPMSGGMMERPPGPGMMGGQPRMDGPQMRPMGMNPRFQMAHRFPPMQGGGRMPFFNNMNNMSRNDDDDDDQQDEMGDSDMRNATETKEWPPDDEVNAEDEDHDSDQMDSDDRMMPPMRHQQQPGMPGFRPMGAGGPGGPFRPRGHMMQGMQGPPNPMLASISQAQSVNSAAIPSMLPLRMMAQSRPQSVLAMPGGGPSAAAFNLAQNLARAGIRIPLPGLPRPGLVPSTAQQRMIPSSPVSVGLNNNTVVVPGGIPSSGMMPNLNIGNRPSPQRSPSPDIPRPSSIPNDNSNSPPPSGPGGGPDGPIPLMQVQAGGNPPSGGAILGRGFSPMTIRPRGGAGLLGVRPGAQTGGGFNRFGGPRPLLGPALGNFERPAFGNRMGMPMRPRLPGFFDEDKDERRRLQKLDVDERPGSGDVDERGGPKDMDERRISPAEEKNVDQVQGGGNKETYLSSGRKSKWSDAEPAAPAAPLPVSNTPVAPDVSDNVTEVNSDEVENESNTEQDNENEEEVADHPAASDNLDNSDSNNNNNDDNNNNEEDRDDGVEEPSEAVEDSLEDKVAEEGTLEDA